MFPPDTAEHRKMEAKKGSVSYDVFLTSIQFRITSTNARVLQRKATKLTSKHASCKPKSLQHPDRSGPALKIRAIGEEERMWHPRVVGHRRLNLYYEI